MTRLRASLRELARWLPALAVMGALFLLSSVSGLRISEDDDLDRPARVLAHLGSYALLAGLLVLALARGERPTSRVTLGAFVLAVLYGVSDEVHQSLVPGRTGRLDDLLVDTAGALLGALAGMTVLGHFGPERGASSDPEASPSRRG